MIVTIGEILVDLIGTQEGEALSFQRFAGGAPFNVVCAAKKMGGECGFVGCVGNDLFGNYLLNFAKEQALDYLDIRLDEDHNTTIALVQLDEHGDRSFCFHRKHTADYQITKTQIENGVKIADTVVLGTLMLSEKKGIEAADCVLELVKKYDKRLCLDVNYREDVFKGRDPKSVYAKYIAAANVLKFSEEELERFVEGDSLFDRLKKTAGENKLVCVSLGRKGCAYAYQGTTAILDTIEVKTVDTTGAGDAFFGCLLAQLDGKDFDRFTANDLRELFHRANICGALTTTRRGAIAALPERNEVFGYRFGTIPGSKGRLH